ncbi:MAG: glycogen synthase GlgA [Candidatus Hydrogenedentota bacterium]
MTIEQKPKSLKVLFIASEIAPLAKTGGLADVGNSLPKALMKLGHDVRLVMPCYATITKEWMGKRLGTFMVYLGRSHIPGGVRLSTLPGSQVPLYLIEQGLYFARSGLYQTGGQPYSDNLERFAFLSLGGIEGVAQTGWVPDVIHCNDWHTALVPAFLKVSQRVHPKWRGLPTVFTIHNLIYQGRFPGSQFYQTGLPDRLFTPDYLEYYGAVNVMKAGIAFSSKVNTVSPRYAQEIQTPEGGWGLDGLLRKRSVDISGILNGIDYSQWNPSKDPLIKGKFSRKRLAGKATCKSALQRTLGLPVRDVPLFGCVSRLVYEKGIDLIIDSLDNLLQQDVQLAVLGSGDPELERRLAEASQKYAKQLNVVLRYDEELAHQFYAGCDFFLMPSRSEPCGLSQMYSLAYGTVPIVHFTGGLANTVRDATPQNIEHGKASGVVFFEASKRAFVGAVARALDLYTKPSILEQLRKNGMAEDFSWERSSRAYEKLYREAMAKP